MGMEWLFILLPVAALSGWVIGRRKTSRKRSLGSERPSLSGDLLRGLNYLLNEQQDEALDVFIRMSEMDSETVDIQFALAGLFLRRGEVDRAIRIHQNIIARPMLSHEQRKRALYELGLDYMRAGLLDRAESLFQDLIDDTRYARLSRLQLLDIYQQEKEWEKAIEIARRLNSRAEKSYSPIIAHYYCELADVAIAKGELGDAGRLLKRAFAEDRNCVRASLLEASIAERQNRHHKALKSYKRVEQQDPELIPVIIEPLKQCYGKLARSDEYVRYLAALSAKNESIPLLLALARELAQLGRQAEAVEKLASSLKSRPSLRTLEYLSELRETSVGMAFGIEPGLLRSVLQHHLESMPAFRCGHCGFASRSMLWQCPSCKQWGKVKPIHGTDAE